MRGEAPASTDRGQDSVPVRRSRLSGTLAWLFAAIGVALLAWYGLVVAEAALYQRAESSTLDRVVNGKAIGTHGPPSRAKQKHQLIGRLEIPRVQMSVMVVDGDDEGTLKTAAGHLPDTPLPWEFGNSAIAGHRDSFFRPLRDVHANDRVRLVTPQGTFHYVVARLRVVEPDDVSVLATSDRSSITLVTCYPFNYIGQAPKRFIVQADHAIE
jgi:sortase A